MIGKNNMIKNKNLISGISQRLDGNMKFHEDENDEKVFENRKKFLESNGISVENLVSCKLVHGKKIAIVGRGDCGSIIADTDGLITSEKDVCISVTVADFLPIYFFDKEKEIIGILHAGYKGVVDRAVVDMVNKMKEEFNSLPSDILVYIGPHIKDCHFCIGDDQKYLYSDFKDFVTSRENGTFVDLCGIVEKDLLELEIPKNNIEISSKCTYCDEELFSYRRDRPEKVNAQIAFICMKK